MNRDTYSSGRELRASSSLTLKLSKDGASPLGKLYLTALTVKDLFLTFSLYLHFQFETVLSQLTLLQHLFPPSLQLPLHRACPSQQEGRTSSQIRT